MIDFDKCFRCVKDYPIRSDYTFRADYVAIERVTVEEFIKYAISQKGCYGRIRISRDRRRNAMGWRIIEYDMAYYCNGGDNMVNYKLPNTIRNAIVKSVAWDGGFAEVDWMLII